MLRAPRGKTGSLGGLSMRCSLVVACFLAISSGSIGADSRTRSAEAGVVQIAQGPVEYQSRPTRKYVEGQKAGDFQRYVNNCLGQIVQRANQNYPSEARGKLYGDLLVAISVRTTTGMIVDVVIERGSESPVLNRALVRAIQDSSPCPPVPANASARLDILVVKQVFSFSKQDRLELLP